MKNSLNIYLKVYIYLVIVHHIVKFIQTIIEFPLALSGILSMPILIWNTILGFTIVLILINILKIKKQALFSFYAIQVINVLVQSIIFDEDFGALAIVAVILCALMTTLLFLKKNGVSSWSLFFDSGIYNEEYNLKDEHDEILTNKKIDNINICNNNAVNANNIPKEDFSESLKDLPLRDDGSFDYEKMSITQQFLYTCQTESIETALDDLEKDIKHIETSINNFKKDIDSSTGGNRAKLRDIIRNEQNKLNELYALKNRYSCTTKNNVRVIKYSNKYVYIFLGVISLLILSFILLKFQESSFDKTQSVIIPKKTTMDVFENEESKHSEVTNNKNKSLHLDKKKALTQENKRRNEIIITKNTLEKVKKELYLSYFQDNISFSSFAGFKEYIKTEKNRHTLYNTLVFGRRGIFNTPFEFDEYLGYGSARYIYQLEVEGDNKIYAIPISLSDDFERDYPEAQIKFIDNEQLFDLPLKYENEFVKESPEARRYIKIEIKNDYQYSKVRLLYCCLIGTGCFSISDLGSIDEFENAINTEFACRELYKMLINKGLDVNEIGSETDFCNNISTDFI